MKFTLKDYQAAAVADVLERLGKAKQMRAMEMTSSLALTAPTGAGKTVMAAAVIESLFFGNADFDVPADPGAVVLWFTSDPSLNEQTRHRIQQASDKVTGNRLKVIENTFQEEKLRPGTVYFLNSQKLGSKSLLVRGSGEQANSEVLAAPDLRSRTFWEILRTTIEDPDLTLYVFLDEAHVGMKRPTTNGRAEKQTIVRQLVNGVSTGSTNDAMPPVPIVLGISATVERFKDAMAGAAGRTTLPDVIVDPVQVQESGLLKDNILLSFPAEAGVFDTVLLRHAVARTKEASHHWAAYHETQGSDGAAVQPLLVLQLPNKPSDELLLEAVQTVLDEWRDIDASNIAHVFGEHTDLEIGAHTIAYVKPEDVQERPHVRVLLAKDAISTGWDCPRAEVLVSFRPAKDATHITQLLGRMVRTPLARRIPADDRLNAVECVLPHFRRDTAEQVAKGILGDAVVTDGARPRVVVDKVELHPNPAVGADVWAAFERLPSQSVPRRGAKPVGRFTSLGAELAYDGIVRDGHATALSELVGVLKGKAARYEEKVEAHVADLLRMSGERLVVGSGSGLISEAGEFALQADDRAIQAEYKAAQRALTPQLANAYAEVLEAEYQDGYFEAHLRTAALSRIPEVIDSLDDEAGALFAAWDNEHRRAIKKLTDSRRAKYDDLRALGGEPGRVDIMRPDVRIEAGVIDGQSVERRAKHLLADADGAFPVGGLNDWELAVVDAELEHCVAWYRNPSRASADALSIAYEDPQSGWRRLCPDFIFFEEVRGAVLPSIVDPHGHHLGDALPKLRGLATYAATYGDQFHRVEALSEIEGELRVLDLTDPGVRQSVMAAEDAATLYLSEAASRY